MRAAWGSRPVERFFAPNPNSAGVTMGGLDLRIGPDGWTASYDGAGQITTIDAMAQSAQGSSGPIRRMTFDLTAAERTGRELIALSPYRENGYRWLMEALDRTGNTAEALRIYEQLRTLLRDELGIAPSGETVRLHDELLRGISRAGSGW